MCVDRIRAPIWLALPFEQGSMWQMYFGTWQEGYVSAQLPNTIHLPANHMKLMDDLLTVLSIESQRTEKDHRSFTNFFDRSWTQIAAGGGNEYMKAQCIGELPSGENNVKVAQENHAEKSVNHNSKSHPDRFIRDPPMNPYHIIYQEAHLLDEIKDIRDEMNMLRTLVEAQDSVWKQAFILDNPSDSSSWNNICTPRQVLQEHEDMKVEAEMIQDAIDTLLDLRQKQAIIKEAEFGRRQANGTGKQSNIILVFTIVTIVFLPLSFLNSLFALDVSVFPHESNDLKYPGWWIFPMIFGISACVSTPLIYVAFNVNRIIRSWEQFKRSRQAKTGSHSTQPASKALGSHELKTPQWEQGRTHEHEHQRGQEPEVNARYLRNLARRWRGSRKEDKSNSSVV